MNGQIINPVLPNLLGTGGIGAGGTAFGSLLGGILGVALIMGAIAAFVFLILGALSWITSSGDKARIEKAQQTITNAIIGLVILAAVWAVMTIVSGFLGLGIFTGTEGTFQLPTLNTTVTGGTSGGGKSGGTGRPPGQPLTPGFSCVNFRCISVSDNAQFPGTSQRVYQDCQRVCIPAN